MVDQYEHNKWLGLVFIGTLTNLMWPQHIEAAVFLAVGQGNVLLQPKGII